MQHVQLCGPHPTQCMHALTYGNACSHLRHNACMLSPTARRLQQPAPVEGQHRVATALLSASPWNTPHTGPLLTRSTSTACRGVSRSRLVCSSSSHENTSSAEGARRPSWSRARACRTSCAAEQVLRRSCTEHTPGAGGASAQAVLHRAYARARQSKCSSGPAQSTRQG